MGNAKVIVAGSINMDVVVRAARHPRPGETLLGQSVQFFAGGKGANQAIAAHRLGARATLIARVGDDSFGGSLRAFVSQEGLDTQRVLATGGASGTALITVADSGENTIVVVPGANGALSPVDVEVDIEPGDVLVSQCEIPAQAIEYFFVRGKRPGALTLLNAAPARPLAPALAAAVDILVVNESELATLAGTAVGARDTGTVIAAARSLQSAIGNVVVTLGERGVVACLGPVVKTVPGRRVEAVADTTGAGDGFVGALAARLAAGEPLAQALVFANAAASICVERPGAAASMPTMAEVLAVL
ncbi:ribokinase [Gloeobacter morelensis]|uniref:Ribokinase n=1 Tax=Gloeobacter morelensis MG652769 TaxID=2781736 RepID=A0ABY3PLL2_9CYAN|nr:ribokinase [Gloeobacter morelensis]UFP94510.1 ribokinase [Gloeobacter morelensis MG652769]